jgi:hypothetical protein
MGQKGLISYADTALANFVWKCIENESLPKINLSQEQISFSSPKCLGTERNSKLSIFLYNITEEITAKNMISSFSLHYIVTPFTGNEKNDHVLLEKIIENLSAQPQIVKTDENTVAVMVKIDSLSLDDLSKLWIALGTSLMPFLSLTVSSAEPPLDLRAQATLTAAIPQAPIVDPNHNTHLYKVVLQAFNEQISGWRNRNMFIKQWMLQDFQKTTGMTVEETQSILNRLGDKLDHRESTTQFIKPLNQLTAYYQHQLDELKGLHKLTHKQTENIETIAIWINDVKALVEGLTRDNLNLK